MRKNPKKQIFVRIGLLLISFVVIRMLQIRVMEVNAKNREDLNFLALKYIIEQYKWDGNKVDSTDGKVHKVNISIYQDSYEKFEDPQLLNRLGHQFPKVVFRKSKEESISAHVWVSIKILKGSAQQIVPMEISYKEMYGGNCGTSGQIAFKRSPSNQEWQPYRKGFWSYGCQ